MQVHHQNMSDPLQCTLCGAVFGRAWLLKQHSLRKTPCVIVGFQPDRLTCSGCGKKFSRIDSLTRHRTKCKQPLIKTAEIVEIAKLRADVEELRKIVELAKPQQLTNVTNNVNNTVNNTINNVTIAPWGAPLQLTDADVEAALASIPCLAGTPAMTEVVAALMELVKRAHLPGAARNNHLNPKRGDQALALTPTAGWAAMPLTEATAALFDGASARIATPVARRRVNALYATVPVQYRADKAQAVALGMRPMEAHLANLGPGGPGPLLLERPAGAAAPAAAAAQPRLDPVEAAALVKRLPASYEPGGAVTAEWLAAVLAETGACTADLIRALRAASARGLCGFAEWQGIMRLGAPPAQ